VISGNDSDGIALDGTGNIVAGNLIGTDATGMLDRGNGDGNINQSAGIILDDDGNQIGGPTAAWRNVISGNASGIRSGVTSATNNTIQNNYIGTNAAGTGALGNNKFGILIVANDNLIGGVAGEGNLIAFSGQNGVGIGQGTGNRVTANSIFSNGLRGIDLQNNGAIETNDNLDPDTGPNNLQNFPVITAAINFGGPSITIIGTLNSAASSTFQIDFYANASCDNSGHGEGQDYLGATSVNTDASGNASFNVTLNVSVPPGRVITATATDATNNTSEFSSCAVPTAADSGVTGRLTASDGVTPVEGAVVRLSGSQTRKTITDANGDYHFDKVETAGFYTIVPSRANYSVNPFSRSFSQLGSHTEASFTANFLGDLSNPLETPEYFVRQQYLDILGREPDEAGFNYWSDQILSCNGDRECDQIKRREVAAAFFIEDEFQRSGAFIYNLYTSGLGRKPTYREYADERKTVIGGTALESAKQLLVERLVQDNDFVAKYQDNTSAAAFVSAILQNVSAVGADLEVERENLLAAYGNGSSLADSRGRVLSAVAENAAFKYSQHNAAFVLTEYFGYLRRDSDAAGFNFWLEVLNQQPQNFRGMVCAFITSAEYQQRFSSILTRSNSECQ
jgi:hypothetical protein